MCRSERISRSKSDMVVYGEWIEATPANVLDCDCIVKAGTEVFGPGTHWIESRELSAQQDDPDIAIKHLIAESMQAWVDGDLDAHTACFLPGAVFISPSGSCYRGHDGLHRAFASERAAMPSLRITPTEIQITYPRADTAIILMEEDIQHSGRKLAERWASTQVAMLTSSQHWRFASQQVFHTR